ncbi:MAG: DUF2946 family protein [Litoreibacter sp.]|uniref:DUF2946 family protein n=1 Tax=Litoreibacter sp. TaxID=1969459 RepID=UPI003299D6EC
MRLISRLFTALLVLTMIATTGSMAAMRDSTSGAQAMVICNGAGLQTILIDADGEQVDPAPICPDCTMVHVHAATSAPELVLQGEVRKSELDLMAHSQPYIRHSYLALKARAPPIG